MLHMLWRNIQPTLKRDFEKLNSFEIRYSNVQSEPNPVDMPLISSYLTIAAFLASVNPPSSDRKFFVKCKSQQKRAEAPPSKGPQAFQHSRFLAIFSQVSESKFMLDSSVLFNIESLCGIGYLSRYDNDDALDEPRYRCHVSQDFVRKLCKAVDFDLDTRLYSRL
jgi:origin recognition complex subunit 5